MLANVLKLSVRDIGRELSEREFDEAEFREGFRYELIDGRLYVSPMPNPAEDYLERWLMGHLMRYADERPDVIKHITNKSRVRVRRRRPTNPEPDIAVYQTYPTYEQILRMKWHQLSPFLVAEVLVEGDFQKDLVRNPKLYWKVPSIREYWVLEAHEDEAAPTLIVHRRGKTGWVRTIHEYRSKYSTALLPGFELPIDPRKRA